MEWHDKIARTSAHVEGNERVPDGVLITCVASTDFSVYEWHLLIKVYSPWPGSCAWVWEPIRHKDAVKLGCGFQNDAKETSLAVAKEKAEAAAYGYLDFASHPQSCYGNKSK